MTPFTQLKRNLKKDFSGRKKIKVALLGDTATQMLVQAIRGLGFENGYDLNIWEADFNQIERQVFDSTSELYEFQPEIVILFQSTHKLLGKYNKSKADLTTFAANELQSITDMYAQISTQLPAKIIFYN